MKKHLKNVIGSNTELLKLLSTFFGANFIFMVATAISGLIVTRMMLPEQLGYYLKASVFLTFTPFVTMGITNGLNRQLPFLLGKNEHEKAMGLANTAFAWSLLTGVIIVVFGFVLTLHEILNTNLFMGFAFASVTITGACLPMIQMTESTFRTNNDFNKLSKIKFMNSVMAILTIPLVHFFSFVGYILRSAILSVFYLFNLQFRKIIKTELNFNRDYFKELMKIGMPIFILGYFYSIFIGLDKLLILKYLTPRELGLYAPAIQVGAALSILPTSIFQILYPKMCRKFGETGRISSLRKITFKTLLYLSIGLLPVFGIGWFLIGPFIRLILPNFVEGIPAAQWMFVAMYFWCLGPAQDVLSTIGVFYPFIIALIIAPIVYIFSSIRLLELNWGLEAIPASFSLSMFVFNAIITGFVYKLIRDDKIKS
jgi:O-antigen/teichoic acid export membrane protein